MTRVCCRWANATRCGWADLNWAALTTALHKHHPGDKITVGWLDASGQTHQASVTLVAGPAD